MIREAFQIKKIAQKGTFVHLGGRGVKKIPIQYYIGNGTYFDGGRGVNPLVPCHIHKKILKIPNIQIKIYKLFF